MTKLQAARLTQNMTQVALSYHSGVSPGDISKFENGRALPYEGQAARLAGVLKILPEELLEQAAEIVETRAGGFRGL